MCIRLELCGHWAKFEHTNTLIVNIYSWQNYCPAVLNALLLWFLSASASLSIHYGFTSKYNLKAIHFIAELQQSQDWHCAFCLWKICSNIQDHLIHAQETDGHDRILKCLSYQNLEAFLPKLIEWRSIVLVLLASRPFVVDKYSCFIFILWSITFCREVTISFALKCIKHT